MDNWRILWIDATDRNAITAAVHSIDKRSGPTPRIRGESREAMTGSSFVPPLVVDFRVSDERSAQVVVLAVRHDPATR